MVKHLLILLKSQSRVEEERTVGCGFSDEKQLKASILKLQEYRQSGITRLRSVKAYYQMKQRRERTKSERHLLSDALGNVKVFILVPLL